MAKLKEEFFKLLPPTIFFFVALHIVLFIRILMLEGTGLFVPQEDGQGEVSLNPKTAYDSLVWKEMITQLKTELERLPEREQAILHKHYIDGVSFDGLSSLLGISKGRISQLHRAALLVLRKRMTDRGHFRVGNIAK